MENEYKFYILFQCDWPYALNGTDDHGQIVCMHQSDSLYRTKSTGKNFF